MKLPEKRLRVSVAIRLEYNSGKRVLNTLEFICDVVSCTEENIIGVVKARTNEGMSDK